VHRSPIRGRIVQQNVRAGDRVSAGDVLLLISPVQFLADGVSSIEIQQDIVNDQWHAITDQWQARKALDAQKHAMLLSQVAASEHKLSLLNMALEERQQILLLARKRLDRAVRLFEQGHIAEVALSDLRERHYVLRLQDIDMQSQMAGEQAQLLSLQQQLNALENESAIAASQYEERLSTLDQQQLQLWQQGFQAVVAAHDGLVDNLTLHIGNEVSAGQALVNVLPDGSELIGVLKVPVSAAGFVNQGQLVELRYGAYPYQKYGTFQGTITQLDEVPNSDSSGAFYYLAKVSLDEDRVLAHGQYHRLKTGMGFEADVVLSRRSFAEWLFEPLYSLRGVAAR
jgi:membrane fusion protein